MLSIMQIKSDRSAKPKLEAKAQLLRIPNECLLLNKEFKPGGIDSSPGLQATYRCSSSAQEIFSTLSSSYKLSGVNITGKYSSESLPEGDALFASISTSAEPSFFLFSLGTTEDSVKDNSLTLDPAIPTTKPAYLGVYVGL